MSVSMKVAMVATSACRPARPCAVLVLAVTMPAPSGKKRAHFGSSADQVIICIVNNRPDGRPGYQKFCKTLRNSAYYKKWSTNEYDGMIGRWSCTTHNGRKLWVQDSNIIGPLSLEDVNDYE
eukprot:scaffold15409_cov53-Attheya_sp.AAC.6